MMGFALLIMFWSFIYVLDLTLKANHMTQERYLIWHLNTGISFGLLRIKWFTKSFNKHFHILGNIPWFPWTLWFSLGVIVTFIALIFGVALLCLLVINTVSQRVVEHEVLTPVMPGINVPFSDVGFLLLTIIIAGVVHELGHAIAAIKEGVRVDGFGLIFFFVYPGAFTSVNSSDLENLDPKRKLRIFSAGNWHNSVSLIIAFCLMKLLPFLLLPFYSTGAGVAVSYLSQNSVLTGKLGLYGGDVITKVNNCPIKNQADWFSCMQRIQHDSDSINSGYCMPLNRIRQLDISSGYKTRTVWGNIDCCANQTRSHLCFRYLSNFRFSGQIFHGPRYACLPARTVTERSPCQTNSNCYPQTHRPDLTCVTPSLENSSRLVRLVHSRASPVLFLGNVDELLQTVTISNFVPRWNFVPNNLPVYLETFFVYLVAISGALILFNSVPCYALDGQWIFQAAVELFLSKLLPNRNIRRKICSFVTLFGTILIFTNVSMSIFFMIKHNS